MDDSAGYDYFWVYLFHVWGCDVRRGTGSSIIVVIITVGEIRGTARVAREKKRKKKTFPVIIQWLRVRDYCVHVRVPM